MPKLFTMLRFVFLAACAWLPAAPTFAQQYMQLPPRSLVGNMLSITNPGSVVLLPELVAALSSFGVTLDKLTSVGDQNYTIDPSARTVATSTPLSVSRTWTLPAASAVNAGHPILIADLAGGVTPSNTLVIASAGTDTINGGPSVTIAAAFGAYYLVSDGSTRWIAQPLGGLSVTPGGGLVSSASGACVQSAITAFGTLSAAQCVNAQTGTSYAILDGDRAKLITASNAAAQAYSIAQAGTAAAFQSGWFVDIHNKSTDPAGIVTVTPTTSTVDGASTLPIYPGQSVRIVSDGSNYQTVNRQLSNTTLQASPSNPTGTVSTSGVMMGLGSTCKLTPSYSTRIKVEFLGSIRNSSATGTSSSNFRFGTGTAPTNGAAQTGTQIGTQMPVDESGANFNLPFVAGGIITGLTPGTAYWFDISLLTGSGANTASLANISCNAFEL